MEVSTFQFPFERDRESNLDPAKSSEMHTQIHFGNSQLVRGSGHIWPIGVPPGQVLPEWGPKECLKRTTHLVLHDSITHIIDEFGHNLGIPLTCHMARSSNAV